MKSFNIIKKSLYLFFVLFFFLHFNKSAVNSQNIAVNSWRTHLDYSNALQIISFQKKIFCLTENGIFYLDTEDQSLNTLSVTEGLSGNRPSFLYKNADNNLMIIAYENGALDFINQSMEITPFLEISNANINTSKRINAITSVNNHFYIASDLGLIKLNYSPSDEISVIGTYLNLSFEGEPLAINDVLINSDVAYLSTKEGILTGALNANLNLKDYKNWNRTSLPQSAEVLSAAIFQNNLYAIGADSSIYSYDTAWTEIAQLPNSINRILYTNDNLLFLAGQKVYQLSSDTVTANLSLNDSGNINDFVNLSGMSYIANSNLGLCKLNGSAIAESIIPQGPKGSLSSVHQLDNYTLYFSEDHSGFSYFFEGRWEYTNTAENNTELPVFIDTDLSLISGNAILLSHDAGLYEWDSRVANKLATQYDSLDTDWEFLSVDPLGKVWALIGVNSQYELYNVDDEESFSIPLNTELEITDYLIAVNGDHYIATSSGIFVTDPEENNNRTLTTGTNNGNLPSNFVTCLRSDFSSNIWIGTRQGVCYLSNLSGVINNDNINAVVPVFEGFLLFDGVNINDIEIDGGNRPWIVNSEGLWLFDENIQINEKHLTTENSPIIQNNIVQTALNVNNGELFVSQGNQLFSFRTASSLSTNSYQDVKTFPNPLIIGQHNQMNISGLAYNSDVSITDLAGNVIYKGKANGGTFNWDLSNYSGYEPQPGVYLVFSINTLGEESYQTKFVITR